MRSTKSPVIYGFATVRQSADRMPHTISAALLLKRGFATSKLSHSKMPLKPQFATVRQLQTNCRRKTVARDLRQCDGPYIYRDRCTDRRTGAARALVPGARPMINEKPAYLIGAYLWERSGGATL